MTSSVRRSLVILLRLSVLPALFISFAILRLFWPRRVVRVVIMEPRFFGHQCLEPEVFWNDWQSAIEQGSSDIWLCSLGKRSAAASQFVWDLRKQSFPVVPSWLVTSVAFWQESLRLPQLQIKHADYHRLNFLTSRETTLPPPSAFDVRRRRILSQLAVPERPYAILTVRETAQGEDLRNRDIREFEPSIVRLIKSGFNVIRLTSRTDNPLNFASPHLLDWQVRVSGEPGDELALVSGSSLVISTTTGIDCLALAYRRPVLYVDAARLFYVFMGTDYTTFQMPQMVDTKSGVLLDLEQILDRGLGWTKHSDAFLDADVRVLNSSPERLAEVVAEYLSVVSTGPQLDSDVSQDRWRELVLCHLGDRVTHRNGVIKARMHPATMRSLL